MTTSANIYFMDGHRLGQESSLQFVAQTALPTAKGTLYVRAYRDKNDGSEPLALFYKQPHEGVEIPVRVHDACMTSEVLGSLKCDCDGQLHYALDYVREHGGVVIYLPQEGRGIGLANKIAAYSLQEQGLDTIEANRALHLPIDARRYDGAADILRDMGIHSIQLMTNNPRKIDKLKEQNVHITKRLDVHIPANPHSIGYLQTKRAHMGHLLGKIQHSS